MEDALAYGRDLGLSPTVAAASLRLDRSPSDTCWVESSDGCVKDIARDKLEPGRYLEYACQDDEGNPQGRGVLCLTGWEDEDKLLFNAEHNVASDDYYQHFVDEQLQDKGGIYHLCNGEAPRCRVKLAKGDKRILVHIDPWRVLNPAVMLGQRYMQVVGMRLARKVLEEAANSRPEPRGTGLDEAIARADHEEKPVGPVVCPATPKDEKEDTERKSKRPQKLKDYLLKQVTKVVDVNKHKDQYRHRSRSRRRRKARRKSPSVDTCSDSSEESAGFQKAPGRGGDIRQVARRRPGELSQRGLQEMVRYLAGRAEDGLPDNAWKGQKVMAYINQVILLRHPPSSIGVRAHRELITLGLCLDHLLEGKVVECTDVLMQRLKAVELSLADNNWHTAKHLEIIPPIAASLAGDAEIERAAKVEWRNAQLKKAQLRATKGY